MGLNQEVVLRPTIDKRTAIALERQDIAAIETAAEWAVPINANYNESNPRICEVHQHMLASYRRVKARRSFVQNTLLSGLEIDPLHELTTYQGIVGLHNESMLDEVAATIQSALDDPKTKHDNAEQLVGAWFKIGALATDAMPIVLTRTREEDQPEMLALRWQL